MGWNMAAWLVVFLGGGLGMGAFATQPARSPAPLPQITPLTADAVNKELKEGRQPKRRPDPPDRLYSVGAGFGVPQLIGLEASIQVLRRWQVGAGVGILPAVSGLIPPLQMSPQSITLIDNNTYRLDGVATTDLEMLLPFVRYFPTRRTTYIQVAATLLRSKHQVTSGLVNDATNEEVPNANITANMVFTHILPTVSLGHFFWNSFFYMNVSLGATFLLSSTSSISLSTDFPGPLGDAIANSSQIQALEASIDRELAQAVGRIRSEVAVLPSFAVTFGVMF